jgi:hypothetical protein
VRILIFDTANACSEIFHRPIRTLPLIESALALAKGTTGETKLSKVLDKE